MDRTSPRGLEQASAQEGLVAADEDAEHGCYEAAAVVAHLARGIVDLGYVGSLSDPPQAGSGNEEAQLEFDVSEHRLHGMIIRKK